MVRKNFLFLLLIMLVASISLFAQLTSLGIVAEVEYSVDPAKFIFNRTSTSSFTLEEFNFDTNTYEYNYTTFYPADSLKVTFPSTGSYQLEAKFYGTTTDTTFTQALVNDCICIPLSPAISSDGMDSNGNPYADTNSNVLTIVADPEGANPTTYTLRFRRRADTTPTAITNIAETSYEFSSLVTGAPSTINEDNIASLQVIRWSVNSGTGTAYFNDNQLIPLSNGDVTVTATLVNNNSITANSGPYTLSGQSNWAPHLGNLQLIDKYANSVNLSPQFSSDPNHSGSLTCSIVEDYSTLKLNLMAPFDSQVYVDDARVSSNGSSILRIGPTDPNDGPSAITYTIRVENLQGSKEYTLNIQREVNERLKFGRATGDTPYLASVDGDVFGLDTEATDKFTIQAWVRWTSEPSTASSWANIASQTTSANGSSGTFWLQHNYNNSSFEFAINPTGARRYVLSDASKVTIERGVWYLVTGVYDGDRNPVKLYVNDEDVTDRTTSTSGIVQALAGSKFNIGKMAHGTRPFLGNIRNLRIWVGEARSASNIANDFLDTPLAGSSSDNSSFSWPLNETASGSIINGNGSLNLSMFNVIEDDFVACCNNNRASGKALVHRPEKMDLSSETSESVILVQADNYSGSNYRFRILAPLDDKTNGMEVWDHINKTWIGDGAISSGVLMDAELGNPATGTYFWVPVRRGNSSTGNGRYVDDDTETNYDGTDDDAGTRTNYNTIMPLPSVTAMGTTFTVSGTLVGTAQHPLTEKYVILGYDAVEKGRLITGTSSITGSKDGKSEGSYTLVSDVPLHRVEVRTQDDILITDLENESGWEENIDLGDTTLPVELSSFTVSAITNGARLQWVTQTESDILGYYVYRAKSEDFDQARLVSPLIASTNSVQTQVYSYTDTDIQVNINYYYWLLASEFSGEFNVFGPINILLEDGGNTSPEIPFITGLDKLYPNPFNPEINISYSLKETADVRISIYNLKGQKMHSEEFISQEKGYHKYVWDGAKHTSGIYFVEFNSGKYKEVRKITLTK